MTSKDKTPRERIVEYLTGKTDGQTMENIRIRVVGITLCSTDAVRNAMRRLVASGEVEKVVSNEDGKATTLYRLVGSKPLPIDDVRTDDELVVGEVSCEHGSPPCASCVVVEEAAATMNDYEKEQQATLDDIVEDVRTHGTHSV